MQTDPLCHACWCGRGPWQGKTIRVDSWEVDEVGEFSLSESGDELNGHDPFIELDFVQKSYTRPHSLNTSSNEEHS